MSIRRISLISAFLFTQTLQAQITATTEIEAPQTLGEAITISEATIEALSNPPLKVLEHATVR